MYEKPTFLCRIKGRRRESGGLKGHKEGRRETAFVSVFFVRFS